MNLYLKEFSSNYTNIHFISRELLYNKENTFEINNLTLPYSLDGGHISILGSKYSAKHFMNKDEYSAIMKLFDLE